MSRLPKHSLDDLLQKRDALERELTSAKYDFEIVDAELGKSEPTGKEEREQARRDAEQLMPHWKRLQSKMFTLDGQIRNINAQIRAYRAREQNREDTLTRERAPNRLARDRDRER